MPRPAILLLLALVAAPGAALGACTEPARGTGEIRAELGRAELSPDERTMISERFAPDFAEAARLGLSADSLFGFAHCELNGAAPAELVAVGRSVAHCSGADHRPGRVCGVWALARTPQGWVQVLESAGRARLGQSTTNGWRDLVLERGGPPAVYKFGGAVYQTDLGPASPMPETLTDYGGDGAGPDGILWYAFDDPLPERAEAAFLWFYANEIRGGDSRVGALPDAFRIGLAELDREPGAEVVVQGLTPAFCRPEGCAHWILTELDSQPPRIAGRLMGFDIAVAASGGAGGRDLILRGAEGLEVWRNDGRGWAPPAGR
ncbi:MAG: hypothetical protein ACQEUZ_08805 [Pseudomonadota bacterium]